VDKKSAMGFSTLNTILNTAPLIIQGATRLIKLIKDRDKPEQEDIPATVEGLKGEMLRINKRLDENYESDIQQIKLIEELARQNELLATSLKKTNRQLNVITVIALISLLVGIVVFLRMLST
jgi:hypothetical protein